MKSIFSTLLLLGATIFLVTAVSSIVLTEEITDDEHAQWVDFKLKYNRTYSHQIEELKKLNVFIDNLRKISIHNSQKLSYRLKINKFGDWTHQEYVNFLKKSSKKGFKFHELDTETEAELIDELKSDDNNSTDVYVDWREKGVVTKVKDQGQCGSCYAFSSTGALEGQYAIKYDKLVSLSEQQILDCSMKQGNLGCDGGLVEYSYKYLKINGSMSEESYPYESVEGYCKFVKEKEIIKVRKFVSIAIGNEQELTKKIAKKGPIAVAIDASQWTFQFYQEGVYDEKNCGKYSWQLDHAVLAVGYGTDNVEQKDYFIVKNSWGEDWGEDGYIRMTRNEHNQCGIATDAVYPIIV